MRKEGAELSAEQKPPLAETNVASKLNERNSWGQVQKSSFALVDGLLGSFSMSVLKDPFLSRFLAFGDWRRSYLLEVPVQPYACYWRQNYREGGPGQV